MSLLKKLEALGDMHVVASSILGVIAYFWVASLLFHLVPVDPTKDSIWWQMPWMFTVIVGSAGPAVLVMAIYSLIVSLIKNR